VDRTGTAEAGAAAVRRAGQSDGIANDPQQRGLWIAVERDVLIEVSQKAHTRTRLRENRFSSMMLFKAQKSQTLAKRF